MAWWHAVPKPPPSKTAQPPKLLDDRKSRLKLRQDAGGEPDLPYIEPELEYLVDHLFEAGPTSAAGMGVIPLTWADLGAWERAAGVRLPLWASRLLRYLSAEYLDESRNADAHNAPPPWQRAPEREKVAKHIKNVLRG